MSRDFSYGLFIILVIVRWKKKPPLFVAVNFPCWILPLCLDRYVHICYTLSRKLSLNSI